MDTQLKIDYDVLHYVHCEDSGGVGNPAIISEQSAPELFKSYTYDQILASCKNLEKQKCFNVSSGSYQTIHLESVREDICKKVLGKLNTKLKK